MTPSRNYPLLHVKLRACCRCHDGPRAAGQAYCRSCKSAYMRAYRSPNYQPRKTAPTRMALILQHFREA